MIGFQKCDEFAHWYIIHLYLSCWDIWATEKVLNYCFSSFTIIILPVTLCNMDTTGNLVPRILIPFKIILRKLHFITILLLIHLLCKPTFAVNGYWAWTLNNCKKWKRDCYLRLFSFNMYTTYEVQEYPSQTSVHAMFQKGTLKEIIARTPAWIRVNHRVIFSMHITWFYFDQSCFTKQYFCNNCSNCAAFFQQSIRFHSTLAVLYEVL